MYWILGIVMCFEVIWYPCLGKKFIEIAISMPFFHTYKLGRKCVSLAPCEFLNSSFRYWEKKKGKKWIISYLTTKRKNTTSTVEKRFVFFFFCFTIFLLNQIEAKPSFGPKKVWMERQEQGKRKGKKVKKNKGKVSF